jgi:hypothetical protein
MRRRRSILVVPGPHGDGAPRTDGGADEPAPFAADDRGEWWWRQPRWSKREWTFDQGGRVAAVLEGESLFSSTSHVRVAGAAWEVHRGWTGNSELRLAGTKEPLARFVSRWNGNGRVETAAGERLELVPHGFFRKSWELRDADEHVLVRFESHDGLTRHELQVQAEDPARRRADLPELLALVAAVVFAPKRHST